MLIAILGVFPIDIVINPYLSRMFINKMIESNMNIKASYVLYMGILIMGGKLLAAILGKVADILYVAFIAIFKRDMREHC